MKRLQLTLAFGLVLTTSAAFAGRPSVIDEARRTGSELPSLKSHLAEISDVNELNARYSLNGVAFPLLLQLNANADEVWTEIQACNGGVSLSAQRFAEGRFCDDETKADQIKTRVAELRASIRMFSQTGVFAANTGALPVFARIPVFGPRSGLQVGINKNLAGFSLSFGGRPKGMIDIRELEAYRARNRAIAQMGEAHPAVFSLSPLLQEMIVRQILEQINDDQLLSKTPKADSLDRLYRTLILARWVPGGDVGIFPKLNFVLLSSTVSALDTVSNGNDDPRSVFTQMMYLSRGTQPSSEYRQLNQSLAAPRDLAKALREVRKLQ